MKPRPILKYVYHGDELNGSDIRSWLKQVRAGEVFPVLRSEPIYNHPDGFVKVLVSKDFEDVAYDPTRNVLVEFVVDNCRMCDRVADSYQKVGEYFSHTDNVVVARINLSKNDIRDINFRDYPSFILYLAGGDGERSRVYFGEALDIGVSMWSVRLDVEIRKVRRRSDGDRTSRSGKENE